MTQANTIRISMHSQQYDTLKIHMKQVPMRWDRAVAVTAISQYRAIESITAEECNNRSNRDISFFS